MTGDYSPVTLHPVQWNGHRLETARLKADMSRGDLAFKMRELSDGAVKPTERSIRGWEKNENEPIGTAAVVAAKAVGVDVEFFYTAEGEDEDPDMLAALYRRAAARRRVVDELADAAKVPRPV